MMATGIDYLLYSCIILFRLTKLERLRFHFPFSVRRKQDFYKKKKKKYIYTLKNLNSLKNLSESELHRSITSRGPKANALGGWSISPRSDGLNGLLTEPSPATSTGSFNDL